MTQATIISRTALLGATLDELLASRFLPRRWTERIWSAYELPEKLQDCVRRLAPNLIWRAYRDEDRTFFAIARVHGEEAEDESTREVDLFLLDEQAAVFSAGVWAHDLEHGWWLDAVLPLSFDSEHGWWLDTLLDSRVVATVYAPRT